MTRSLTSRPSTPGHLGRHIKQRRCISQAAAESESSADTLKYSSGNCVPPLVAWDSCQSVLDHGPTSDHQSVPVE